MIFALVTHSESAGLSFCTSFSTMSINSYFLRQSDSRLRNKSSASDAAEDANTEANEATSMLASDGAMDPALQEVIRAVTENLTKVFEDKLKPISQFLQSHQEQLQDHETRITEAEKRVSDLEDVSAPMLTKIKSLEKKVAELTERSDDLENRGRRKNIRVLNLPEGTEGNDPVSFFEQWFPKLLNIETKSGRLKVERAHRTGPTSARDLRPRPVIVRLHNFQDKQRIVNASWDKSKNNQPLKCGDATVLIYQDFSAAVVRKRKGFDHVKRRLSAVGAVYRMLYPASLKVSHRGATNVYADPSDVDKYLETLGQHVDNMNPPV